ncbi:MAG: hypothetical protein KDB00_08850 [Planctomycetales bacterium]|nr:hypothetical protein [Planctomycetales bacterium]
MTRYHFELAVPDDDAALRRLMAETPMPGDVTLAFEREPNFFDGNQVLGRECQTIVCRDLSCGRIVCIATRSSRMVYVGGKQTRIGYLGGLRFAPRVRGSGLLARGFQFLRQLHDADPKRPKYYLTTIASTNANAKRVLTSGRANLPNYHRIGTLNTFALATHRLSRSRLGGQSSASCDLSIIRLSDLPSMEPWLTFLDEMARRRTFFPVYDHEDFHPSTGTFRGLAPADIIVVLRDNEIVATAGAWNQSAFRQTVVRNYRPAIRMARPLSNLWAKVSGQVVLPRIGNPLAAAYVSLLAVRGDDRHLMVTTLIELAKRCDAPMLLLGRCDGDPLLSSCWRLSRLRYETELYAVNWGPISNLPKNQTGHPFYLELGCL